MTSDQCAPARKLDRIPKLFWHRPDLAGLRCPLLLSPSYKMNHGPLTRSGKTGKNSCLARISRHARGRGAAILDVPKSDAGNADGLSSTLCRTAFPRRTPGESRRASRRPRLGEISGLGTVSKSSAASADRPLQLKIRKAPCLNGFSNRVTLDNRRNRCGF